MLFPQPLNKHEYIRVLKIEKGNEDDPDLSLPEYLKTFDEFKAFVMKYRYRYDLYVGLATVQEKQGKKSGEASYNSKRHVLYLDFDSQDYPNLKSVEEYSELISSKTRLFNHMVVDSGHGYHYYFCTEATRDINRLVELNKALAKLTGADMNAVKTTQVARIPCSYNHKIVDDEGNKMYDYTPENKDLLGPVKIINHGLNTVNFYRYSIAKLEKQITHDTQTEERLKEYREAVSDYEPKTERCFYCIDTIRHTGAEQGTRNFWLGRITNWHKKLGHNYDFTKQDIIRWNNLCNPPENENKLLDSFNRYWRNDEYKLLGCANAIPNERHKQSVEAVCDKGKCLSDGIIHDVVLKKQDGVKIASDLLTPSKMRKMTGYHFLLLTMIYVYQNNYDTQGFTVANLNRRMTTKLGHGKHRMTHTCMSEDTLKKRLKELEADGIITITAPKSNPNAKFGRYKLRVVKKFREFRNGYIQFYFSACNALRIGAIDYNAYKVYLALMHHLQKGMSCTYEALSDYLKMAKSHISTYIQELEESGLIIVRKRLLTESGMTCNAYTAHNPDSIKGVILSSENDNCEFDMIDEITLVA